MLPAVLEISVDGEIFAATETLSIKDDSGGIDIEPGDEISLKGTSTITSDDVVIEVTDALDDFSADDNARNLIFDELPFSNDDTFINEFRDPIDLNVVDHESGDMSTPLHRTTAPYCTTVALAEGFGLGKDVVDYSDEEDEDYIDRESRVILCLICFNDFLGDKILHCYECTLYICIKCMSSHIRSKINDGVVRVCCAGDGCSKVLSDQMIAAFSPELMPILTKNRIEIENNPFKKTCPDCHKVEVISDLNDLSQRQIWCRDCSLQWCHFCHAPWHSGISCRNYQKDVVGLGKKALKYWAKSKGKETVNARKCPSCQFYIERISGCDHMTCNRCNTDFCYKCGEKHRSLGWLGDHYSTYSFLGCKFNLLPKRPALRFAVRLCACFAVILGSPIAAILLICGAICLIAISPILIPMVILKKCSR